MPTPPIAVPAGQSVVWVTSGTQTTSAGFGCTATATSTTGVNTQQFSAPLSGSSSRIIWSNYAVPGILTRPGAIIHGIYPVLEATYSDSNSTFQLHLNGTPISGAPWNGIGGIGSGRWFNSAGTNLSVFSTMTIQTDTIATLPIGVINDLLTTTYTGIAVYIDTPPVPSVMVSVSNSIRSNVGFN